MKVRITAGFILLLALFWGCARPGNVIYEESLSYSASGRITLDMKGSAETFPVAVYGTYPDRLRLDVRAPFLGTVAILLMRDGQLSMIDLSKRDCYLLNEDAIRHITDIDITPADLSAMLALQLHDGDLPGCTVDTTGNKRREICCDEYCLTVSYDKFEHESPRPNDFFLPPVGLTLDTIGLDGVQLGTDQP